MSLTSKTSASAEALIEEIRTLREEMAELRIEVRRSTCVRCSTPPPPHPRWPGDPWSRDERPPHTCQVFGGAR
jgi:hypothetical protein